MPPHQIETFLLDSSLYYSILQIQGKFLMNHLALVHETSVSFGVVLLTRMPNVMGSTLAASYSFNMPMEISSEL